MLTADLLSHVCFHTDDAQISEAREILREILDVRQKYLSDSHIATAEATYALGILHFVTGSSESALNLFSLALQVYESQLGPEDESTLAVKASLDRASKLASVAPALEASHRDRHEADPETVSIGPPEPHPIEDEDIPAEIDADNTLSVTNAT